MLRPLMAQVPKTAPSSKKVKVKQAPVIYEVTGPSSGKVYEIESPDGSLPEELLNAIAEEDKKFGDARAKEAAGQKKLAASGNQLGGPKTPLPAKKKQGGLGIIDAIDEGIQGLYRRVAGDAAADQAEYDRKNVTFQGAIKRQKKASEIVAPASKAVGDAIKIGASELAAAVTQYQLGDAAKLRGDLAKTAADPKNPMSNAAKVAKGASRFVAGALNPVGIAEFGLKAVEDPLGTVKGATVDQVAIALDPTKPIEERTEAWLGIATLLLPLGVKGAPKLAKAANAVKLAKELGINPIQAGKILNELDKVIAAEPRVRTLVERTEYASPANKVPAETPEPGTSGPTRRPTISRGPSKTVLKKRKPTMIAEPDIPELNQAPVAPVVAPQGGRSFEEIVAEARQMEAEQAKPQPAPTEPVPVAPEPTPSQPARTTPKEPWELTNGEWSELRKAAAQAEIDGLKLGMPGGERTRKGGLGTAERIRLEYGVEPAPVRKRGVPVVTHKRVIEKALAEGKPVPAEVLADYPDLAAKYGPTAPETPVAAPKPVTPIPTPEAPVVPPTGVYDRTTTLKTGNGSPVAINYRTGTVDVDMGGGKKQTVKAKIFDFDGSPLAVHKRIVTEGSNPGGYVWTVTEPSTGLFIGHGMSEAGAISRAQLLLKNGDNLRAAVERAAGKTDAPVPAEVPPAPIPEPVTVPETRGKPVDPTGAPQLVTTTQGDLLKTVSKEPTRQAPNRRRATPEEKVDVVQTGKRGEPGVTAGSNLGQKDVLQSVGLDPLPGGARGKKATQEEIANAFDEKTLEAAVERINKQVTDGESIDRLSDAEIQNLAVQSRRVADVMDDLNRKLGKVGNDPKRKQVYQDDFDAAKEKLIAYTKAARATGSATARALAARNAALLDDYSTVGLYNRLERATDGNITPEAEARVKDAEKQAGSKGSQGKTMGDIKDELAAIEEGKSQEQASKNFNETAKEVQAKGGRVSTKEQRAVLTARLKSTALEALAAVQKAARQAGPQNLGLQALSDATVAVAPYVKQMVRDAIELGAVSLKGASDIVRKQFEEAGYDLTEQQVTEIMAGKLDEPKPKREKTVYQQITQEAKAIIAKQYKAVADAEKAAIAEARKSDPNFAKTAEELAKDIAKQRVAFLKRQEVLIRQGEISKWKKEQAAQAKIERQRIAAARKRGKAFEDAARREYKEFWQNSVEAQRERIIEAIDKVGKGPIGPPKPPRNKFEDDPEVQRLNAELEAKKKEVGTWQDSVQAARARLQKRIDDFGKEKKERPKRNEYLDDPEIQKLNAELKAKQEGLAAAKKAKVEAEKNTVEYARKRLRERIANLGKPKKPKTERNKFEDDPEVRRLNIELETKKLAIDRALNKIEQERIQREMTGGQKFGEALFAIGNAQRTVRASFDFGVAMNQGLFYSLTHPLKSAKYLGESMVRGWTRKGTDKVLASIRTDAYYDKARAGKLGIDTVYGDKVDDYLNIDEKLTETGGAFNPLGVSQRAMDIYLARVRMDMFKEYASSVEKGKTLTLKDYKEIAEVVNTLTGTNRYNLGQGGKIASATIFAPKYTISRIETALMTPVLKNIKRNPKLALKAAGDYMKMSASILGLKLAADALIDMTSTKEEKAANQANRDASSDPRSKKLLVATKEPLQAKLSGNLLQFYQLIRQIGERQMNNATGVPYQNGRKLDTTMKIGKDGKPRPTEKYSDYTAKDAMGAVSDFLGGKVSPAVSLAFGLADGERYGKPMNLNTSEGTTNVILQFFPILVENGVDIVNDKRLSKEEKALSLFTAVFNAPLGPTFDKEKNAKPKPPPKL